jgi:hypothetical protein
MPKNQKIAISRDKIQASRLAMNSSSIKSDQMVGKIGIDVFKNDISSLCS